MSKKPATLGDVRAALEAIDHAYDELDGAPYGIVDQKIFDLLESEDARLTAKLRKLEEAARP